MEAKFFKNEEDMTVEDITNVFYTACQYFLFPLPLFDVLIGKNFKTYILDVLIENGIINPKQYSLFEKMNDKKTLLKDITDKIYQKWVDEDKRSCFDKDLFKCYLSAIILKSDTKIMHFWFTQDLPALGAIDESIANSPDVKRVRQHYQANYKKVTRPQWIQLTSICV